MINFNLLTQLSTSCSPMIVDKYYSRVPDSLQGCKFTYGGPKVIFQSPLPQQHHRDSYYTRNMFIKVDFVPIHKEKPCIIKWAKLPRTVNIKQDKVKY